MDFKELRRRLKEEEATRPLSEQPDEAEEAEWEELEADEESEEPEEHEEAETADEEEPAAGAEIAEQTDAEGDEESTGEDAGEAEAFAEGVEIIRFRLDREHFAIELDEIEEIVKPKALTWVPRVPDWILGVLSLRGTMMPVVDLRRRLSLTAENGDQRRIIVVSYDGEPCGLLVDEVLNVVEIHPDQDIEDVPAALQERAGRFLEGLVRFETALVAMVDLASVLDTEGWLDERAA